MESKNLFKIFTVLAVASLVLDCLITIVGLEKYIIFSEVNPHILFLMRFTSSSNAVLIVFFVTLTFLLVSYWMVRGYFKKSPYNGGLVRVWRHLWYTESVTRRDLVIFALIALYLYFTYSHLWGVKTWIDLFTRHGL